MGANDDCGFSLTSCVVLSVTAGTQYYAQVDGYSSTNSGLVEFTVAVTPANDAFASYVKTTPSTPSTHAPTGVSLISHTLHLRWSFAHCCPMSTFVCVASGRCL